MFKLCSLSDILKRVLILSLLSFVLSACQTPKTYKAAEILAYLEDKKVELNTILRKHGFSEFQSYSQHQYFRLGSFPGKAADLSLLWEMETQETYYFLNFYNPYKKDKVIDSELVSTTINTLALKVTSTEEVEDFYDDPSGDYSVGMDGEKSKGSSPDENHFSFKKDPEVGDILAVNGKAIVSDEAQIFNLVEELAKKWKYPTENAEYYVVYRAFYDKTEITLTMDMNIYGNNNQKDTFSLQYFHNLEALDKIGENFNGNLYKELIGCLSDNIITAEFLAEFTDSDNPKYAIENDFTVFHKEYQNNQEQWEIYFNVLEGFLAGEIYEILNYQGSLNNSSK